MPDPKIITTHAERLAFWLDKLELAGQATISIEIRHLREAIEDSEGHSDFARRLICTKVIGAARERAKAPANGWQP